MLNVITLFSGYDSQCLALRRLGIDFNLVAWSEIDRNAIKAHDVLFPEFAGRNLGDVTKADWSQIHEPIDLLTYSSPCQDFSVAGLQRGGDAGSGTRSSLLWEVERAIDALHPCYLLLENVAALVGTKFMPLFERWCRLLESKGYHNTWQILNAKHYGVPQNRRRVFLVSKYHDETPYYFPQPFKLEKHLCDVLEDNVDERYYLSEERVYGLLASTMREQEAGRGYKFAPKTGDESYANCITTHAGSRKTDNFIAEPQFHQVGNLVETGNLDNPQRGHIYGTIGIVPCHNTEAGGGLRPKIVTIDTTKVATCAMRGRNKNKHSDKYEQHLEVGSELTTNTITSVAKDSMVIEQHSCVVEKSIATNTDDHGRYCESKEVSPTIKASECEYVRIRRLTERELYRLMDVDDKDIDMLLKSDIARTQHSKLAGNSIVVGVLYHIFRKLLVDTDPA